MILLAWLLLFATPDIEMLTHVPLLSHGSPKKVLLIGDAPLQEILRYPTIESIVLLAPTPSKHPKVKTANQDPFTYLKTCEDTFDAILSTEPLTSEGATLANQHLAESGILAIRFPLKPPPLPHSRFYLSCSDTGPSYFLLSAKNPALLKTPKKTLEKRLRTLTGELHYYTPSIHRASFALPKDAEQALKKSQKEEGKGKK